MDDHPLIPNLSASIPNFVAKNVFPSGHVTVPPTESLAKTASAAASLSGSIVIAKFRASRTAHSGSPTSPMRVHRRLPRCAAGPGGATATIKRLWGLYGLTSVFGALAVGRLLKAPLGRGAMAFTGLAGAAGCAAALVSVQAAVPNAILLGVSLTATPAAATAFRPRAHHAAGAPVAIAAITVAVGIGQLIGPLAAGVAADHLGLSSVALVAGCVHLFGSALAVVDAFIARETAA